jgi:predicted aconitase with swiveling domain
MSNDSQGTRVPQAWDTAGAGSSAEQAAHNAAHPAADIQHLSGRVIKAGRAEGVALVSSQPVGFLGGVDPETGIVVEPGHPLEGQCVTGRVLVFPTGKGSTVGSYTLYRMARAGTAPAAIVNADSEAIVAVGAIIGDIPMVDQVEIARIRTGDWVRVEGERVLVKR